jgi:hypothetical protein
MTTFDWDISVLNAYPEAEGQTDVVFTVHWRLTGTDGTYSANVYSTCGVTYEAGTPYTPFAELTKEQVLGWVWASGVSKEGTENVVQQMIDNQINPPVVTLSPPWAAK